MKNLDLIKNNNQANANSDNFSYPTLDNVLNSNVNNDNNNFCQNNINNLNPINIIPVQNSNLNINLNNFNSGMNSGNSYSQRKLSNYMKNQNEDFENILNSKNKNNHNKDNDPFEGYY